MYLCSFTLLIHTEVQNIDFENQNHTKEKEVERRRWRERERENETKHYYLLFHTRFVLAFYWAKMSPLLLNELMNESFLALVVCVCLCAMVMISCNWQPMISLSNLVHKIANHIISSQFYRYFFFKRKHMLCSLICLAVV